MNQKKVLSYSFFKPPIARTDLSFYTSFLPTLVRAHLALYPPESGFELRLHHDETLYQIPYGDTLQRLHDQGLLKLVYAGRARSLCEPMLWRLNPIWDPDVQAVFCRDVDALPTPRDRYAIEHFLVSGKTWHSLHDSPSHGRGLCGGLMGVRADRIREKQPENPIPRIVGSIKNLDLDNLPRDKSGRPLAWAHVSYGAVVISEVDFDAPGADQDVIAIWHGSWPDPDDVHHDDVPEGQERTAIAPVPLPDVDSEILEQGDSLCNHLGQAGYDVERAASFFDDRSHTVWGIERAPETNKPDAKAPIAVLACDRNPDYSFFLPIDVALWHRIGYRTLILLVGKPSTWQSGPSGEALRAAHGQGADIRFIPEIEGFRTSTVAQVARLFAAALPDLDPTDMLLTTDADLWPLNKEFYAAPNNAGVVDLFYGNAYDFNRYPMCHLRADVATWREIMGIPLHPTGITAPLTKTLTVALGDGASPDAAWNFDEQLFAARLHRWEGFPDQTKLIARSGAPPEDRIDRSNWPKMVNDRSAAFWVERKKCVDAHVLRPGHSNENWPRLRPLLETLLTPPQMKFLDSYRTRFQEALECPPGTTLT